MQPPWVSKVSARIYSKITGTISYKKRKTLLRKLKISKAQTSWTLCYSKDVTGSSFIEGPLEKFQTIWRNFTLEMSLNSPKTMMTCKRSKIQRRKRKKNLRTPRVRERKKKSAMTMKKMVV